MCEKAFRKIISSLLLTPLEIITEKRSRQQIIKEIIFTTLLLSCENILKECPRTIKKFNNFMRLCANIYCVLPHAKGVHDNEKNSFPLKKFMETRKDGNLPGLVNKNN